MNKRIFEDMGFTEITRLDGVISLLENDPKGLTNFLKKLKKKRQDGRIISSIVMNCNPFTLGHQYLIEYVSNNSDVVHVFVVWEDRSVFPNDVRYRLVKAGIKHLPNVIIHKGKDYIISNSTFPSYFIKEKNSIVKIHAQLDLKIFGEFIAPALGINRRYVGHEPIDPLTREYNAVMKNLLPQYGIEVFEINRLEYRGLAISASRIRQAIKDDNLDSIKEMVPKSTYEFLISEEAKPIIDKIKSL
jgi:[citrate (pro-3S)-lyase] ligase